MTRPDLVRPHYRERQQLGVDDLDTEQAYLIATRRRHDVTAHTPGLAHGLTLSIQATGCVIAAGLAVDGPGHTIVLPDPVLLRWSDLPAGADALDLFVSYREEVVADRVTEGVDVLVASVQLTGGVAAPTQAPAVYVGRLGRGPTPGPPYVPVPSDVTFEAAVGATVAAPTGTTVELAADPAVTVLVPDATGQPVGRLSVSPTRGTGVDGALVARSVELTEDQPLRFGDPVPAPQAAWPWRWYHSETVTDGVVTAQQLRVELGAPATTEMPDWFQFAVDDGSGSFPLSVDAAGATTVGPLTVEGKLVLAPPAPDPNDPRLVGKLVRTWTGAVDVVSRAVDKQFSGDLFDTTALTVAVTVVPPRTTPPRPPELVYTMTVSNISGQPVTDLTLAAVNTINNTRTSERLVKLDTPLAPGADYPFTHHLPLPGLVGVTVHVELVALGLLPGGKVTLGVNNFDWQGPTPPIPSRSAGRLFFWR